MPSVPLTESAFLVLTVPIVYFAMVFLGRRLKRHDGVRLGLMYQLFAITLAFYLPVAVMDMDYPYRPKLVAAVVILGAIFLNALIKRNVFELHYQERRHASVPKFLSEVVALLVIVLAVILVRGGDSTRVAVLRAGDCFGEMSLLTGEKRSATVIAQTDCEVVEIGKPVLANGLKQQPELLNKLSELLARRQLETEGILAENTARKAIATKQTEYAVTFLDKLKAFFEL